jgi:hypothetical protein
MDDAAAGAAPRHDSSLAATDQGQGLVWPGTRTAPHAGSKLKALEGLAIMPAQGVVPPLATTTLRLRYTAASTAAAAAAAAHDRGLISLPGGAVAVGVRGALVCEVAHATMCVPLQVSCAVQRCQPLGICGSSHCILPCCM